MMERFKTVIGERGSAPDDLFDPDTKPGKSSASLLQDKGFASPSSPHKYLTPHNFEVTARETTFLKDNTMDTRTYLIGLDEFSAFVSTLPNPESIGPIKSLQFYLILTVPMTGKSQFATGLNKLEEYPNDQTSAAKALMKEVKLHAKMTSAACAEGYKVFMELLNFFRSTKIQGHDGIINPNELFTMRWYFATVVRALYAKTDPRMDIIIPLLENLLIIYAALERDTKALLPSEVAELSDPAFVRMITRTSESALTVAWHDGLDKVTYDRINDNIIEYFLISKQPDLHQPLANRKTVAPLIPDKYLMFLYGLSRTTVELATNLVIECHGGAADANKILKGLTSPKDIEYDMGTYSSLNDIWLRITERAAVANCIRVIICAHPLDVPAIVAQGFIRIISKAKHGGKSNDSGGTNPDPLGTDKFRKLIVLGDDVGERHVKIIKEAIAELDEYEVATSVSSTSSLLTRLTTKFEVLAPKAPRNAEEIIP